MVKAKITVLSDNNTDNIKLKNEHGLSLIINFENKNILFDCSQTAAFIENADVLNIDLKKIDKIILSHGHYDHTGGLKELLVKLNRNIDVYAHPLIFEKKYSIGSGQSEKNDTPIESRYIGSKFDKETYERYGAKFILNSQPFYLSEGLILTGLIPMENDFEKVEESFYKKITIAQNEDCFIKDNMEDDNSLILKDASSIAIITGCAHRGIINIINYAIKLTGIKKIKAVIGGFHLKNSGENLIERTISELSKFDIDLIVPMHCTGSYASKKIKEEFGSRCIIGYCGLDIKI